MKFIYFFPPGKLLSNIQSKYDYSPKDGSAPFSGSPTTACDNVCRCLLEVANTIRIHQVRLFYFIFLFGLVWFSLVWFGLVLFSFIYFVISHLLCILKCNVLWYLSISHFISSQRIILHCIPSCLIISSYDIVPYRISSRIYLEL